MTTCDNNQSKHDTTKVLIHPLLIAISVLISNPSIQIEVEVEVEVVAQVVVVVVNINIGSKMRVKVMEEEGKIIEAGGELKIKMQTEIIIMHLMLNVGHVVSGVTTQVNVQQHEGGQIIEVEGEGNNTIMLQQTGTTMMMIGPSSASNHMTSHGEWFKEMKQLDGPGYVETGDDSAHPIAHVEKLPLQMQDGKMKYLVDVIHVPNITKNLVLVGQMIEQGLQLPQKKQAKQWGKAPYEADELFTHEKSHITDEVLAQILAHIFIAKFRDEEGDNIKTTIMPREIWTLHKRPDVADPVKAVHLEQFFKLPPWGTDYMRAHELMSSIQYDGKAMITDKDGVKVQLLITTDIVNEALHFYPETYDLIAKTKSIDNEKAFLKAKGSKYKYADMIYSELELPLRLISQHFWVQKPPRYTVLLLHMAVVMALCVAKKRQIRCNYGKFILEILIEANLKNSSRNKLYMSAVPMLTRIAYQDLGSNKEDSQKGTEAKGPFEHEPSDQEDTSTPLDKNSKKPRSAEQILLDEAMARVEARKKELANARAAKAAKSTKPTTMEEARKLKMEKAKALQEERRRLETEKKAQEEVVAAQEAQTKEKEIVDLLGTIEYLKKVEREKHIEE
ncbi:hypothetical protein L7F22_016815 [Adiantum nelumboides]|nr:hypothetical protein [Adiantum nelumboides]